jgi:quaternary ammonium compound-resistance protein SugE
MNPWLVLTLAGGLEIVWAIGLKYAEGFTKPLPSAITIAAMIASMYLLAQAARTLPIGTAYAVWTGIGAVGATLFGIMLFSESANPVRLACIALIVIGIAGLKLSSPA